MLLTLLTKRTKKKKNMLRLALLLEGTLKKSNKKTAASELCILSFKNDCIRFLSTIVIKLFGKDLL